MGLVEQLHDNIDSEKIWQEIYTLLLSQDELKNLDQISLTSIDGNDDWTCSVGRISTLEYPERYYSTINKTLAGTELEKTLNRYPQYYRWRLMKIDPKKTYSVHKDGNAISDNLRIHIPLQTNEGCFLCFYLTVPLNQKDSVVRHVHLETGKSYIVNTTGFHTAVNYGNTQRYHLVGVKYENSNNRTQ